MSGSVRDFGLSVSDGWLLFFIGIVGIYLAFEVYRERLRGVSQVLLAVRVVALVLLVGLLMEPLLALTLQTQRLPLVAVLVDDSESMQIADGDTARFEVVKKVLGNPAFDALGDRARVKYFRFSDVLTPLAGVEELSWMGRATDVSGALDGIREKTLGEGLVAVVLVSDGGQNLGGRPERSAVDLGAPILAVGIGDPVAPKDVAIVSTIVDPLGYVGRPLVMQVRVVASGFERMHEQIRILQDGKEVGSKTITLSDGEQNFAFEIRPERAGRHTFEVVVADQSGERTVANNRIVLTTEVLKSRMRILMLAGSPSADLSFLRRVLESDSNVEVDLLVRTRAAGWRREVLRHSRFERDVVVLLNMPYTELAGQAEHALVGFVKNGGGLLVIGGDAAFEQGYILSALAEVLPVQFLRSSSTFQEGTFALSFPEDRHPILRVSEDPLADRDAWDELPPLLSYNRVGAAVSDATILAHHPTERVGGKPMPLMAIRRVGSGKTMVVGCHTFWRHGLVMWGDGKTDKVAQAFWKNVVQWLVTRDDISRLKIVTEKSVYRSSEPVTVHAQVFDQLLQPRAGAEVRAGVVDSLGMRNIALRDLGGGRYAGNLGRFPQGDYELQVQARADDGDLGAGTSHFTVGRYSLEYETVRMRAELLRDMASRSGGQYLRPDGLDAVLDSLILAPEPVVNHHRTRLWGQQWPLFVLVGLLVLEWTVRRRLGMI